MKSIPVWISKESMVQKQVHDLVSCKEVDITKFFMIIWCLYQACKFTRCSHSLYMCAVTPDIQLVK
jgi:putative ribosome biogenesis GTPase RsgA